MCFFQSSISCAKFLTSATSTTSVARWPTLSAWSSLKRSKVSRSRSLTAEQWEGSTGSATSRDGQLKCRVFPYRYLIRKQHSIKLLSLSFHVQTLVLITVLKAKIYQSRNLRNLCVKQKKLALYFHYTKWFLSHNQCILNTFTGIWPENNCSIFVSKTVGKKVIQ